MILWDALLVALAGLHGVVVLSAASIPLIGVGVWWNANTISHNFIHRPFFRNAALRALFSAYLSVLLGIPQALWRERHLAHHEGGEWRFRPTIQILIEIGLVFGLWTTLAFTNPRFLLFTCLPAYGIGLALCGLQGHYEHALGATSHYGKAVQPALLQRRLSRRASRWMGSGDARYRGAFAGGLETTIPANCCSHRGADPHRTACGYSRRYSWPRTQRDRDARE